ncbi:hypothetical protein [Bradyrhizobium sp. CCBAU 11434]|uniref:hypothetical protein n=1 Tax=Bradyrhizobium sp. CCBAU 11434 TaxID=1630885 RepID=UPI002305886E|nr:hypothetical protein [Bradyrhizobium sp. CCBAU 11434]
MPDEFDPRIEPEARRIADEMGNPKVTEVDWDVFFGRRTGALSVAASSKMLYAYTAARLVAREEF